MTLAARERGVSRPELIRQQLMVVLEQYRYHPKPQCAGIIRSLPGGGDESERSGDRH